MAETGTDYCENFVRQAQTYARHGLSNLRELADGRTVAIGEHHRAAGFDNGGCLRGHDVRAKIEFARRDANDREHDRAGKTDDHDLEMGGPIRGVQ